MATSMQDDREELPKVPDEDSEDELLLKDHWCDDNWVPMTDEAASAHDSRLTRGRKGSDDDLLLKAAQGKCK
jgi:hypothetical protein